MSAVWPIETIDEIPDFEGFDVAPVYADDFWADKGLAEATIRN